MRSTASKKAVASTRGKEACEWSRAKERRERVVVVSGVLRQMVECRVHALRCRSYSSSSPKSVSELEAAGHRLAGDERSPWTLDYRAVPIHATVVE